MSTEAEDQLRFYETGRHAHVQPRGGDFYAAKLVRMLARAAGIGPSDRVLEVGAGFGRFSFDLLDHCGSLVACDVAPRGRLLDLGCGMGGLLRELEGGASCFGTDRSAYALRVCREKGATGLARADLLATPFRDGAFDTLLALDVIEHLDDDVEFLRRASRLLAPGGCFATVVPTFALLWSQHDEIFHHKRYRAADLTAAVRAAGLVPVRTTYLHPWIFPLALTWRVFARSLRIGPKHYFWPLPRWLNRAFGSIYRIEALWLRHAALPFGVSVACVARRGP